MGQAPSSVTTHAQRTDVSVFEVAMAPVQRCQLLPIHVLMLISIRMVLSHGGGHEVVHLRRVR